jgi:hypothetical protein
MCVREKVYLGIKHAGDDRKDIDLPMDFSSEIAMAAGSDMHAHLQHWNIGRTGILKGTWICAFCDTRHEDCFHPRKCKTCDDSAMLYEEYTVYDGAHRVRGHIDGLICLNRLAAVLKGLDPYTIPEEEEELVILEIKTSNEWAYNAVKKSGEIPIGYRVQASFYQMMTGISTTLFLYVNMNTRNTFDLLYTGEPALIDEYGEKINTIWKGIAAGTVPDSEWRACASPRCERAKACPFMLECFAEEEG